MSTRVSAAFCSLIAIFLLALPALAKPRIVIAIQQFKEVADGRSTKLVPAQSASPGDVVEYQLVYRNEGDEPATNAVIQDPIPKGTTYLANSANGDGTEITFSSDKGQTFAPPVKLTYDVKLPNGSVEKRTVTPAEYTNVRWTVKQVPAGASGKVVFRVRVN
ncbi:MAG TPA: hypothetical protein VGH20_11390 [Myxococcales bacterium]|jgi:uncharacterized repeat protein (TIGR01451 family)